MENRQDMAIKKEREIQHLVDKIETMAHTLDGMDGLSASLLNVLLDYYYINDFNGSVLEEDHGLIGFVGIEKMRNAYRIIKLLRESKGINEENDHKVSIMLKVLKKLKDDDKVRNDEIYRATHEQNVHVSMSDSKAIK